MQIRNNPSLSFGQGFSKASMVKKNTQNLLVSLRDDGFISVLTEDGHVILTKPMLKEDLNNAGNLNKLVKELLQRARRILQPPTKLGPQDISL